MFTYEDAVKAIDAIPKFLEAPSVEHTRAVLDAIGSPDQGMKIIHVAGTNGKGSVCAFVSSMLAAQGMKVGTFTSPHLIKMNERIKINNVPVSDEEVKLLNRPGVKLLADAFHMAEEGTPAEVVENCGGRILHCHMAEAPDRTCPGQPTTGDINFNKRFAASLIKSGYTGGVSAECGYTDFKKNVPEILAYMRELFPREEN